MVITFSGKNDVTIKGKNETVTVDSTVKIGSFTVPSAGEFDISGVQCESLYLSQGMVHFFAMEDLQITYLTEINQEVTTLDDAPATDILILDIRSDNKPDQLKPILKALEPSYLLLVGAGATPEFVTELHLPVHPESSLKVTAGSLPDEGTYVMAAA